MDTTPWSSNDLAKTYDEKYTILEEARLEYDREVRALLKEVAAALQAGKLAQGIEQVARAPRFVEDKPGSSGRCVLEYGVPAAGVESGLLVSTWFSSAWDDVPGHLYVAMRAPSLDTWRVGQMRSFGQAQGWANGRNVIQGRPMGDPEGIYAEAVKLADPDLVSMAADTLQRFLLLAHGVALQLKAHRDLELRMEELLARTRHWLHGIPVLANFPEHSTEIDDWEGQRYLQLWVANGKPGFWLGHHLERETLMFGHNPKLGRDFEVRMRDELRERPGCESFERYCNEPSGTVLGREALREASDDAILRTMREAYETFIRVLSEWTSSAASATP